jgi:hypothetical protein
MSAEDDFMTKLAHVKLAHVERDVPVQLYGKQAARRYLDGEVGTMTDAVREIAKEAGLGPEHARRVAEASNQAAWAHTKDKGALAHFQPANPDEVIGALNRAPETMGMPVLDYAQEPAGRVDAPAGDLYAMFGLDAPEVEKVASVQQRVHWRDVARLEGSESRARHDVDRLTLVMASTGDDLYGMVKQAHLEHGHGVLQMGRAIIDACESEEFGQHIVKQIGARMESEGCHRLTPAQEMQKVAEVMVVDHGHPILAAARALEAMSTLHYTRQDDMEMARQQHLEAARVYRHM